VTWSYRAANPNVGGNIERYDGPRGVRATSTLHDRTLTMRARRTEDLDSGTRAVMSPSRDGWRQRFVISNNLLSAINELI
jgi:hypothetical protein